MTPDEILHEMGWAVSFSGIGALEGPKWWVVNGTPMGSIAGRNIKVTAPHGATVEEAADLFKQAVDDPKRESDINWTLEEIEADIASAERRLEHLRWMRNRRVKGLDIFGIERDPEKDAESQDGGE